MTITPHAAPALTDLDAFLDDVRRRFEQTYSFSRLRSDGEGGFEEDTYKIGAHGELTPAGRRALGRAIISVAPRYGIRLDR
ncbi:hypothetical protein [Sinomonas halotolerans]|uniref:Uncharacterized protein n=1 Tax=Sinomonas halotolerans TaxID=1644133 RepID=A0ABU9WW24_9MICC